MVSNFCSGGFIQKQLVKIFLVVVSFKASDNKFGILVMWCRLTYDVIFKSFFSFQKCFAILFYLTKELFNPKSATATLQLQTCNFIGKSGTVGYILFSEWEVFLFESY